MSSEDVSIKCPQCGSKDIRANAETGFNQCRECDAIFY